MVLAFEALGRAWSFALVKFGFQPDKRRTHTEVARRALLEIRELDEIHIFTTVCGDGARQVDSGKGLAAGSDGNIEQHSASPARLCNLFCLASETCVRSNPKTPGQNLRLHGLRHRTCNLLLRNTDALNSAGLA